MSRSNEDVLSVLARIEQKLDTLLARRRPNTRKVSKAPPKPIKFPAHLDTPAFRDVWVKWVAYRKERRKPLVATTVEFQMERLGKMTEAQATEAIRTAIERSWTGLFRMEEKPKTLWEDDEYYPG